MTELIITSSLLIATIAALRLVLKGRISLRLQYGLWALVLLRLLMPVSLFQSSFSVMNRAEALPLVSSLDAVRDFDSLEYQNGALLGYYPGDYTRDHPTVIAMDKTRTDFQRLQAALSAKTALTRVWLAGAALFALAFVSSNAAFSLRLRRSRKLLNALAFENVHPALRACPLPVYTAACLPSPCLYGVFRPAIYLTPEALSDEAALSHVLAHELSHYHHGDNLWCAMRALCLCVYWFDPLVWLAAVLSKRDGELACDEAAIARLGETQRSAYGRTLISLACKKPRPADILCTATTMNGGKRTIKERITMIAHKPKMLFTTLSAVILITAVAVGCTFTGSKTEPIVSPDDHNIPEVMSPLDELCSKLRSTSLSEYADSGQDPMALIDELREAIKTEDPDAEQMRALLTAAGSFDGAYAEGYSSVVATLYINYHEVFTAVFTDMSFEQRETVYNMALYVIPYLDTTVLGVQNIEISENDRAAAEKLIRDSFDNGVRTLVSLYYSPYVCNIARSEYLANRKDEGIAPENVLVLLCDYDLSTTDPQSSGYTPNGDGLPKRYENWKLILVRDSESSPWRIADQGY